MDNSVLLGLLEEPFPGPASDHTPLPTVTAIVRGPSGRHVWSMQLRHHPRSEKVRGREGEGERRREGEGERRGGGEKVRGRGGEGERR